ncbi:MAG: RNA polymerase sigma factor, partial [Ferruginibacter sp.]
MNEKELITRLKRNEEAAFRELVEVFQDKVFNTAIGMLQKSTDAEDIAQEVFIQVYKSIADFKENAALSTWIYRITVT